MTGTTPDEPLADEGGSLTKAGPKVGLVITALVVVYIVWGSTYLGIRIVVEEAPPLITMGLRFTTAALLLGSILVVRGGLRRLTIGRRELLGAAFLGLMLPMLGNGLVSVGENMGAPSGVTGCDRSPCSASSSGSWVWRSWCSWDVAVATSTWHRPW